MNPVSIEPAGFSQASPERIVLTGRWTARGLGDVDHRLEAASVPAGNVVLVDGSRVEALDTAGAWILHRLLRRLAGHGTPLVVSDLELPFARLMDVLAPAFSDQAPIALPSSSHEWNVLARIGHRTVKAIEAAAAMLVFIGEIFASLARCIAHPARLRWRPILFNIRTAGFDALPIVGLLSFLLGVVVAYQGADQLRQYGANIFIADLVGVSMLREFAPLITAIIVAGRSGSSYAAQIGTMAVTEEIDAMRTLGIDPQAMLVLPKLIALVIALPLLTVFADVLGVLGGMIMARQQLDVGYNEFLDRFVKAVVTSTALTGVGKAPVFAVIIAVTGCYQGFRTRGGADSVGRQTTRSVVQSIFLVIVADALFSIVFSALNL